MVHIKTITIGETEYPLLYNAEAHFILKERYGHTAKTIIKGDAKSYAATLDAITTMNEQAILARKHYGYDSTPVLSLEELKAAASVRDLPVLVSRALEAISAGLEVEETHNNEPVDLVLAELEKKTTIR